MIPDKIYIPQNINRSDVTSLSFPDDKGRGIEYIRKEALLEWLNRMLEISAQSLEFQRNYAYGKVIDKLNEM